MSSFVQPISPAGPIVQISVGFSPGREAALRRLGRPVLSRIIFSAPLDTGADVSMIDQGRLTPFVRDGMELKAFVHVNAPGMGGLGLFPRFLCGLDILHPSGSRQQHFRLGAIELIERPLGSPDFQALIGRDILSRCVFNFDDPANRFSLSY